jgi:hypothetical protein
MKTLIGIAILAGAGYLAWSFYKQSLGVQAGNRIAPQPSGFDYASAIPQPVNPRTSAGHQIIGTAVPRTTTTTTAGTRGHIAPTTLTTNSAPITGTFGYNAPDVMIAEDTGGVLAI